MNVVLFLGGFVVGVVITYLLCRLRTSYGTLLIDQSNPEKDIYRMDFKQLDGLEKKRRVVLKVNPHATLSQN